MTPRKPASELRGAPQAAGADRPVIAALWLLSQLGAGAALAVSFPLSAAYFLGSGDTPAPFWTSTFRTFADPAAEYQFFGRLYATAVLLEVAGVVAYGLGAAHRREPRLVVQAASFGGGLALALAGLALEFVFDRPESATGLAAAVILSVGLTDYAVRAVRAGDRPDPLVIPPLVALPALALIAGLVNTHVPTGQLMWWHLAWGVVGFRESGGEATPEVKKRG